jgi:phosphoribosylanthranilate isomerase
VTARVKICGLSTPETLEAALNAGTDFIGLMFFAKSPRNVSLRQAAELAERARGRALISTVTVNADDTLISSIADNVRPDFIQAHGDETPERIAAMARLTGISVYKVLKVRNLEHMARAKDYTSSRFMMYDAMPPEDAVLPGGNGLAFDWTILKDAGHPFMLAGGLNPDNVAEAIRVTSAAMVDVSSGVESSPGVKDVARIRKFIEAAKQAG